MKPKAVQLVQLITLRLLIACGGVLCYLAMNAAVLGDEKHPDQAARKPSGDEQWGHLRGRIRVTGQIPPPEKLVITQNREYCGDHNLQDESLVVGDHQGLANVFVFLYEKRREKQEPAIHPDYQATEKEPVTLDNVNCRFAPHALCLRTSQPLIAKNSDPVGHNANFESRIIENSINKQLQANDAQTLNFHVSERQPVKVSCGSHGWMSAYVLIRDEPYMTVTDKTGAFEIRNLPAGEWTFQFWHERVKEMSDLMSEGQGAVGQKGELTVTIRPDQTTDLGELTIDISKLSADR